jgi:hypothetical protein
MSTARCIKEGTAMARDTGAVNGPGAPGTTPRPRDAESLPVPAAQRLEAGLRDRLVGVIEEGREIFYRFDDEVRTRAFHPFVAADYNRVLDALLRLYSPGMSFLEWGSATGVITIIADMIGYDACGIELDAELVDEARGLAERHGSNARFVAGSFLPTGYRYRTSDGDTRLGTIGEGESGYLQLQRPLDEFDLVFGYPWSGEAAMMHDLMWAYGRRDALLLLHGLDDVELYRGGARLEFTGSTGPGAHDPGPSLP